MSLPDDLNLARSNAGWIRQGRRALAAGAVERLQDRRPDLVDGYGLRGFTELLTDTEVRIEYFAAALAVGEPVLFADHVAWLKANLASRGLAADFLPQHLEALLEELEAQAPEEAVPILRTIAAAGRRATSEAPAEIPTLLTDANPHLEQARSYLRAVLEGRRRDAERIVLQLVDGGVRPYDVEKSVVTAAQQELGRMWQLGEIHPAEEHAATRIAEGISALLRSRVPDEPERDLRVLLASVSGNDHDLAVRILADRFEQAGWQAISLGANSPADSIAQAADDHAVHLVALSATTALHVETARSVIAALREMPDGAARPILLGGRPFEIVPGLHERIGADATAATLQDAIDTADALVR